MEETFSFKFTTISRNWEFSSSGFAARSLGYVARLGLSGSWPEILAAKLWAPAPRFGPMKVPRL
ncbi:UNVERIFIED_CONTAM: hypothetical protein Sradi_2384600 [Sesamum radiatum]|uniref:Uncharacterized protein n=1 Tax=Sesamum radiatum TaxID=300843 RepID=A0AAW2T8F4_SESRA